jgi:hypothetical protein
MSGHIIVALGGVLHVIVGRLEIVLHRRLKGVLWLLMRWERITKLISCHACHRSLALLLTEHALSLLLFAQSLFRFVAFLLGLVCLHLLL